MPLHRLRTRHPDYRQYMACMTAMMLSVPDIQKSSNHSEINSQIGQCHYEIGLDQPYRTLSSTFNFNESLVAIWSTQPKAEVIHPFEPETAAKIAFYHLISLLAVFYDNNKDCILVYRWKNLVS